MLGVLSLYLGCSGFLILQGLSRMVKCIPMGSLTTSGREYLEAGA